MARAIFIEQALIKNGVFKRIEFSPPKAPTGIARAEEQIHSEYIPRMNPHHSRNRFRAQAL